jgi:hypothetical protein
VKCPNPDCNAPATLAREGGWILKSRYVRVTPNGRILIACDRCGSELERLPATGRLVLCKRQACAASSSGSSGNGPPAG